MKPLRTILCALTAMMILTGGNCSRERVESVTKMNEGVSYAQSQQYQQAIETLREATALDPTNDQAFFNLAVVYIERGDFELAKEQLQRAISLVPDSAGYQEKLGVVAIQLEDWSGAQAAFESAIELDEDLFKAYFRLGQIHERLDQPQIALQRYTESIERGPRFINAYDHLGRLYLDLKFMDQAVQVLEAGAEVALRGTEEEASLLAMLANAHQQAENYDAAIATYTAALAIVAGMPDALFGLGWTYYEMDDREQARRYMLRFRDAAGPETPQQYKTAAATVLSRLETL